MKDIDHKKFKSHFDCQNYLIGLQSDKHKACFTDEAVFKKHTKKVKNEHRSK